MTQKMKRNKNKLEKIHSEEEVGEDSTEEEEETFKTKETEAMEEGLQGAEEI